MYCQLCLSNLDEIMPEIFRLKKKITLRQCSCQSFTCSISFVNGLNYHCFQRIDLSKQIIRHSVLLVLSNLDNHLGKKVVFCVIGEGLIEEVHFSEINVYKLVDIFVYEKKCKQI